MLKSYERVVESQSFTVNSKYLRKGDFIFTTSCTASRISFILKRKKKRLYICLHNRLIKKEN